MNKLSVLVIGAEPKAQAEIDRALRDIAVVASVPADPKRTVEDYLLTNPGVVMVALTYSPSASFNLVSELVAAGVKVIVVSHNKDPDLILQAMRAGAREFLLETDQDGLRRAVRELAKRPEDSGVRGTVTTIFPTRGGVGATSLAANIAGALQRLGEKVCLLDLDLYLGDVLSFLDLPGTYSISDVLANMKRLDRDLLDSSVVRHPSGIRVLAQSGKVEEAEHVRAADVAPLVDFLRQHYDRIVIDGVRGFDELSLAALDVSQKVVMILTQDVPAVRNTKRCLDLFRRLGYADDKIQLVLNRYLKDSKITSQVVAETVGLAVAHEVANDYASAIKGINRGLLLFDVAPRSKLTKDIDHLAPLVVGANADLRRKGFFRNLLGKKDTDGAERAS